MQLSNGLGLPKFVELPEDKFERADFLENLGMTVEDNGRGKLSVEFMQTTIKIDSNFKTLEDVLELLISRAYRKGFDKGVESSQQVIKQALGII